MTKQKIEVLLREGIDGHKEVFALFPYEVGAQSPYSCAGYRVTDQHSCYDAVSAVQWSKPAKLTDPRTIALLKDLRAIYTVKILEKFSPARSLNTRKMLLEEMEKRAEKAFEKSLRKNIICITFSKAMKLLDAGKRVSHIKWPDSYLYNNDGQVFIHIPHKTDEFYIIDLAECLSNDWYEVKGDNNDLDD